MSGPLIEVVRSSVLGLHLIGWGLLYSVPLGAVLAAGVGAMLRLLRHRSAWARYSLCCGSLVLLVGVPLQAWWSIRGAYAGHEPRADAIAAQLLDAGAPDGTGPLPGGWTFAALSRSIQRVHDGAMRPRVDGGTAVVFGSALAILAGLWFVGAVWRLVRVGSALCAVRRLATRDVTPASERWERVLGEIRRRVAVRHPVRLGVTPHVDGPLLIGYWRPIILLPPGPHRWLTDLEAEAILAHELAHVRRGDYAVNLVQLVAEAVLFYHPVVAWLSDRIRDEREYCSDDFACRSIRGTLADYLRALTTLEGFRVQPPEPAVAASGRSLLSRARRLADQSRRAGGPRVDVDLLFVGVCLVLLWLPAATASYGSREVSLVVMEHEMRLPRDFERIYRETSEASRPDLTGGLER